jgi:hypothetical protein
MPWELIADYRPPLGATGEDVRWTHLALGLTKGLLDLEPRLRFRIRNLPQGVRSMKEQAGEHGQGVVVEQPVSLDSNDVPEALRPRLEIPRAGQFWVRNYYCQECVDPSGKAGVWVPHIRRKLHMKGRPVVFSLPSPEGTAQAEARLHRSDPRKGNIQMKGIRSTWVPTHQVVFGSPSRLRANRFVVSLRYSVAVTSEPEQPLALEGFSAVLLLPLRKDVDYEAVAAGLRSALPECETVVVLPRSPKDGIRALLEILKGVDSAALESPNDETDDDAADVMLRIADARAALLTDSTSSQAATEMASALVDLSHVVPERARVAGEAAATLGREGAADMTVPDWLFRIDAAVEGVRALLDPELQDQIDRDRSARRTVAGMLEQRRVQAAGLTTTDPKVGSAS